MTGLRKRKRDVGLLWFVLAIASLPLVGVVVRGAWSSGELGVSVMLVALASGQLIREYFMRGPT